MPRRGIRALYEQLSGFKRCRIIRLEERGWTHSEELLVIWVEAMRPLENADKNGWTMTDFCVMMVAVDLGSQQIRRTD
ncbi:hypothetical protein TNCV_1567021 [Trichonephila clavipes]|nr:hypothetical protein TNCV_1567021 [Trichonephila clavipes]